MAASRAESIDASDYRGRYQKTFYHNRIYCFIDTFDISLNFNLKNKKIDGKKMGQASSICVFGEYIGNLAFLVASQKGYN